MIETLVEALLLLALTLGGGLAALVAWTGSLGLPPLGADLALIAAVAIVAGVVGLPFSYVSTFRIEAQFGFNRTTRALWLADLAKGVAVAAVLGLPLAALVLWLMRAAGPLLVAVGLARVDRVPVPRAGALSDGDRAALQQVLAAARGPGARGDRGAARTLRLREQGALRHGRVAPVEPRQRVLHRVRPREAHRLLRHAARAPRARRNRGRPRARAWPFPAPSRAEANGVVGGARPRLSRASRAARGGAVVLRRTRRSGRDGAAGRRADPVLPRAAGVHVHAGTAVVALLPAPRIRGRCLRRQATRPRPRSCTHSSSSTKTTPPR